MAESPIPGSTVQGYPFVPFQIDTDSLDLSVQLSCNSEQPYEVVTSANHGYATIARSVNSNNACTLAVTKDGSTENVAFNVFEVSAYIYPPDYANIIPAFPYVPLVVNDLGASGPYDVSLFCNIDGSLTPISTQTVSTAESEVDFLTSTSEILTSIPPSRLEIACYFNISNISPSPALPVFLRLANYIMLPVQGSSLPAILPIAVEVNGNYDPQSFFRLDINCQDEDHTNIFSTSMPIQADVVGYFYNPVNVNGTCTLSSSDLQTSVDFFIYPVYNEIVVLSTAAVPQISFSITDVTDVFYIISFSCTYSDGSIYEFREFRLEAGNSASIPTSTNLNGICTIVANGDYLLVNEVAFQIYEVPIVSPSGNAVVISASQAYEVLIRIIN